MPMDPRKLRALSSSSPAKGSKKRTSPGPEVDEEDDDYIEEPEEDEEAEMAEAVAPDEEDDGEAPAGGSLPRPGSALPMLIKYADEIEASSDEMDYDTLVDVDLELSSEDLALLQEGILMLPPRLQKNLWNLEGISIEDAMALAETVASENEAVTDMERFAGWLYRAGQLLVPPDDEEPPLPEDDEDDEDDDMDEEMDDGMDDRSERDRSTSGLTA